MTTLDLRTRAAWRRWLARHHAAASEIWLVFHKAHTGTRSIDYEDAVEEALCFGWIDSLIKRLDADRYVRKFTPRTPGSVWSASNRRRYAKVKVEGRLAAAGIARAPGARSPSTPPLPDVSKLPGDVARALEAAPRAWTHFQRLSPSHRRRYLLWIATAKQEDTRERRLRETVRLLLRGQELGLR